MGDAVARAAQLIEETPGCDGAVALLREGRAFEWMDRAYDERDSFFLLLRSQRLLDPMRSDPRFGALLRRTWLR